MPAFEEVDWSSDFGKALTEQLQCTTYHKNDPERDHDKGTKFMSKDEALKNDKRSKILYELAYKAYIRSLQLAKEKEENN
jgi:hypothetical protein